MTPTPDARLLPLSELIARRPDDQEPAPDFVANLHGENVEVTAVLERTARRARADRARQAAAEARPATAPRPTARPAQPAADATSSRPLDAAATGRPLTASVVAKTPVPAGTKMPPAEDSLASELRSARQRIAELVAELENLRAVALDVQRRVEIAVGRRAA